MATQNFDAAGEVIQKMAAGIGGYSQGNAETHERVSDTIFWGCLERLITQHPASVALAPRIWDALQRNGRFSYNDAVLELFAAHGSPQAMAQLWDRVANNPFGRAMYLASYGNATLAAAGIVR
jgi:hypothetical protein